MTCDREQVGYNYSLRLENTLVNVCLVRGVRQLRKALLIAALPVVFSGVAAQVGSDPFGYVSDIAGKWHADKQLLDIWSPIPKNAEITVSASTKSDRLQILEHEKNSFLVIDCAVQDCTRPIRINEETARQMFSVKAQFLAAKKAIVEAVQDQFKQYPKRYSYHAARGGELTDAVVLAKHGVVDLQPVVSGIDRGRYWLRLQPVDSAEESTATTSFEAAFPWDPSSPMTLTLGPIKSPLQELLLLRRSGEMMYPTGQSAWILICPSSSYVSTESAFREAISLTQEWAAQVDSSARTIFLRAYLGHISAQCR